MEGAAALPIAASVPKWVGRMYMEPGGAGTSAEKRATQSVIMAVVMAGSTSGSASNWLLWTKRATLRSIRTR